MNDKELLELAAKAAGLIIVGEVDKMICQPDHRTCGFIIRNDRGGDSCWNPLTDDGDALRLAVKLKLSIQFENGQYSFIEVMTDDESLWHQEEYAKDINKSTRRAIVCVAAEIGKNAA